MKKIIIGVVALLCVSAYALCQSDNLEVKIFRLRSVSARSVYAVVKDLKSQEGGMSIDERSNSLIVSDTPWNIKKISDMIARIDYKEKQVEIKASIFETSDEALTRLGLAKSQLIIPEGQLVAVFNALKDDSRTLLRSEMSVKVLSNYPATLQASSDEIFGQTVIRYRNNTEVSYPIRASVGEFLEVLPRVNEDDTINVIVRPSMISMNENNAPSERTIFTQVLVHSGDTVVLGGLDTIETQQEKNKSFFGLPFNKNTSSSRKKVVMFLTARISD